MTPDKLHVVTVRENPRRFNTPDRLYDQFEEQMLDQGVSLTVVECQHGARPFALDGRPHINHVGVRATTMMWHKENLINLGVARLPHDWKYMAWVDSDVYFRQHNWATETIHALQHYKLLQPWETCYDLGPHDEHLELHKSFGWVYTKGGPIMQGPKHPKAPYPFAHPGYAWAITRDAYVGVGGLIETAVLGAADHHMALASINRADDSIPTNITQSYKAPIHRWQRNARVAINDRVGYIPGTIEHSFHGAKKNRNYISRWSILIDNEFNPLEDMKRNEYGVFDLCGNKPKLTRQIEGYFASRNEDCTYTGH